MKKVLVIVTALMLMLSPLVYAGGGKGYGGKGKGYGGTTGSGTMNKIRKQSRDGSGTGTAGSKGSGDVTRTRAQKRDGSCSDQME